MSSKLVPANPSEVMVIRKVTDNIVTLSSPFARFGLMKVGGRGTMVRLPSGAVAVFSPTALTPEVKETVKSLGQVKYLTALDFEHHIFLDAWHKEYPDAKVLGPEGLPEKRAKQKDEDVRFDIIFTAQNMETQRVDDEFDAEFDYTYVHAHSNKELVFNYKRDRTLIEADLLFNLPAIEQYSRSNENPHEGFLTNLFIKLNSTAGDAPWQRRFIWNIVCQNKADFKRSIGIIDRWDFDRIVPCHGDVIETGGKGIFRKVMKWHLANQQ